MLNHEQYLLSSTIKIEEYIKQAFDNMKTTGRVAGAMKYSVEAGGKRLRPVFLLEVFHLFPNESKPEAYRMAVCFALALEFIHTYSLVHDDLPAMDNDMYRRGKLTTHAEFGEAMGILTGDALLNEAFTMIAKELVHLSTLEGQADLLKRALRAQVVLAECAGMDGMIAGQEMDLQAEGQTLTTEQHLMMYELKTSRLLEAAFSIGAILGGGSLEEEKDAFLAASALGKAFQLRDDILDIVGDEKKLGKPVNSDEKNKKSTYVSLSGMQKTEEEIRHLSEEAVQRISKLPGNTIFLTWLTNALIHREF